MSQEQRRVHFFYRKKRDSGNNSIENSFNTVIEVLKNRGGGTYEKIESSYYSNGLMNRLKAVWEARHRQGDINHITGDVHFLAFGLASERTILTIHDCGFLKNTSNPLKKWLLKLFWLDGPIRKSRLVTTVSEATKQDIMAYTKCPADKIVVVPTVITPDFRPYPKPFNTEKPRILHIGTDGNKNLERHVAALQGLSCHLHIIGRLNPTQQAFLDNSGIEYSNAYQLSNQAVVEAYAAADIILFASTLEGFGMPILEAQTVGRPVVTSNISSMPEVAGNAACLVDPLSIDSIRAGVVRLIEDTTYRNDLITKGFDNIKRYQAETVAQQYLDVYEYLLSSKID